MTKFENNATNYDRWGFDGSTGNAGGHQHGCQCDYCNPHPGRVAPVSATNYDRWGFDGSTGNAGGHQHGCQCDYCNPHRGKR